MEGYIAQISIIIIQYTDLQVTGQTFERGVTTTVSDFIEKPSPDTLNIFMEAQNGKPQVNGTQWFPS